MSQFSNLGMYLCLLILLTLLIVEVYENGVKRQQLLYLIYHKKISSEKDLEIMRSLKILTRKQIWSLTKDQNGDNNYITFYKRGEWGYLSIHRDLIHHYKEDLLKEILSDESSKLKMRIVNPVIYLDNGVEIKSTRLVLQVTRIK